MRFLCSIVLMAIVHFCAASALAQDELVIVKNKGGVTTIKDKTKPLRRELEVVFAERVQAVKNKDAETMIARISPDYSASLPNGQTMNSEQIKNYIRRGAEQFVEVGDLKITIESLTPHGNEAIVEARQYFPRKQKLRDGQIHDVFSSVLQTETWVLTAEGWRLKRVENVREQTLTVDGKSQDPSKPYDPGAPPFVPDKKP